MFLHLSLDIFLVAAIFAQLIKLLSLKLVLVFREKFQNLENEFQKNELNLRWYILFILIHVHKYICLFIFICVCTYT